MTTSEQVAGEAREKLADRISELSRRARQSETALGFNGSSVADLGFLMLRNEAVILAALRAQPERGAEEMRERAASLTESFPDTILQFYERPGSPPGNGHVPVTRQHIAAAIRTLPLHPDKDEGGGR